MCRAKYHKLKYGTELQQGDVKPPIFEDGVGGVASTGVDVAADGESIFITNSNVNWRQGRQLLRQCVLDSLIHRSLFLLPRLACPLHPFRSPFLMDFAYYGGQWNLTANDAFLR